MGDLLVRVDWIGEELRFANVPSQRIVNQFEELIRLHPKHSFWRNKPIEKADFTAHDYGPELTGLEALVKLRMEVVFTPGPRLKWSTPRERIVKELHEKMHDPWMTMIDRARFQMQVLRKNRPRDPQILKAAMKHPSLLLPPGIDSVADIEARCGPTPTVRG